MAITIDCNFRVSPGDEVGNDPVLKCCGGHTMTTARDPRGRTIHTCVSCGTRAYVDKHGLFSGARGLHA